MFSSIFASVMLATAIVTPLVQYHSPKNASNTLTYLSGTYCVREDIDWYSFAESYSDIHFTNDDFNRSGDYSAYYDGNYYIHVTERLKLDINYDTDETIQFAFEFDDNYHVVSLNWYYLYDEQSQIVQEFQFTIEGACYVNNDLFTCWNNIFTKSGNTYNPVYTGWFTFNSNVTMRSDFFVGGNININNTLYTEMSVNYGRFTALCYDLFGNSTGIDVYDNGVFQPKINNAYFTGVMFTSDSYLKLQNYGTFDFIPQVTQFTFGEMIFSVVDAPIYMLSQLFSFELFGIQFYVAFMGIVTLILICFVLRKIM